MLVFFILLINADTPKPSATATTATGRSKFEYESEAATTYGDVADGVGRGKSRAC